MPTKQTTSPRPYRKRHKRRIKKIRFNYKKLIAILLAGGISLSTISCCQKNKDTSKIITTEDEDEITPENETTEINTNNLQTKQEPLPETIYFIEHIITYGETLSEIANIYGTSIAEIIKYNQIEDPNNIEIGTHIKIRLNNKYDSIEYKTTPWDDELTTNGYVKGIDLSHVGQETINLEEVFHQNNIRFAMIRTSYFIAESNVDLNNDGIDDNFEKYALTCAKNNIPFGIYFWPSLESISKTFQEFAIITNELEKLKKEYNIVPEMPICIDIEEQKDGGGNIIEKLTNRDSETIKSLQYLIESLKEYNYYPAIYIGDNCLNYPNVKEIITDLNTAIWLPVYPHNDIVHYTKEPDLNVKTDYKGNCLIKQYTQNGRVEGYDKAIDLDVCYENIPNFIRENRLNNYEVKEDVGINLKKYK